MSIGATLRQAREQKGVSLEELARLTRVQPRLLDALEHEARSLLPPKPFLRGMVSAAAELPDWEAARERIFVAIR